MTSSQNQPLKTESRSIESTGWRNILAKSSAGQPITRSTRAANARVVLLIDVSGSMDGGPLDEAKRGANNFAKEAIGSGYSVALVSFGSTACVQSDFTFDADALGQCIARLAVSGSTNMAAAFAEGGRLFDKAGTTSAVCVVTDGCPDDRDLTIQEAATLKQRGIDILTLGTESADHDFLRSIASSKELAHKGNSRTLSADMGRLAKLLPSCAGRGLLDGS
ncbi:MAG TPA: vWA domain-containing protein [Kiritimatiellia bacterium]|nr:vWA domain-containing protein [Kiritimatiellia bacterium]HMP00647.1 vWA domain-containing protein [Kiritimatiellia bacterium]